jgi:uroporphyrinogen decarboxylase
VPIAELFADPAMMEMVLGEKFPVDLRSLVGSTGRRNVNVDLMVVKKLLDMIVKFCYDAGFDYVYMYPTINFPRENFMSARDTAEVTNYASGQRYWQDETTGPIQNWEDFERYPWPTPEATFYGAVDYVSTALPDGMKVCVNLGGVFENVSWLMGFQSFSYALFDQPDLIAAMFEKVSDVTLAAIKHCGP